MTPAERCQRWEAIAQQQQMLAILCRHHEDTAEILAAIKQVLDRLARAEQALYVNAAHLAKPLDAFAAMLRFVLEMFSSVTDPEDQRRLSRAQSWIQNYLNGMPPGKNTPEQN